MVSLMMISDMINCMLEAEAKPGLKRFMPPQEPPRAP
jgi:hypothetical protein